MATVQSMSLDRLLDLEADTVIGGHIDGSGHLILEQHDGSTIDAGTALAAIPDASTTVEGVVELATDAETLARADGSKAVTPLSLVGTYNAIDTRLDDLEAEPGERVQYLGSNVKAESDSITTYPTGVSHMSVTTGSGWTPNSGIGSIVTHNMLATRNVQWFHAAETADTWVRNYYTGQGWEAWKLVVIEQRLTAASYNQASAFTTYPLNVSYLYLNSTESTTGSWDFAGKYALVTTFRWSGDVAVQTYQKHVGGSSADTELWQRTANLTSGWSNWRVIVDDTQGYTAYSPTFSGTMGNGTIVGRYKKVGKQCHYTGILTFGSTMSFGAPALSISLPFTRNTTVSIVGTAIMLDSSASTAGYRVAAALETSSTAVLFIFDGGAVFATQPFTWATGDLLRWSITYETA